MEQAEAAGSCCHIPSTRQLPEVRAVLFVNPAHCAWISPSKVDAADDLSRCSVSPFGAQNLQAEDSNCTAASYEFILNIGGSQIQKAGRASTGLPCTLRCAALGSNSHPTGVASTPGHVSSFHSESAASNAFPAAGQPSLRSGTCTCSTPPRFLVRLPRQQHFMQ